MGEEGVSGLRPRLIGLKHLSLQVGSLREDIDVVAGLRISQNRSSGYLRLRPFRLDSDW